MQRVKINLTKSSSAAERTRRLLGNTSTCPHVLRHVKKSSSAAGHTRRRLLVSPDVGC